MAPARLNLANNHASLTDLAGWLESLVDHHGLPAATAFRLDLVLTEAVTNIMDYAQPSDREGRIELSCAVRDQAIEIELTDDGPAFDPTARPETALPASLAEATPGGLGIHLMRKYTTAMAYQRLGERNVLRMTLPIETLPIEPVKQTA